jgi:hypothetical protein
MAPWFARAGIDDACALGRGCEQQRAGKKRCEDD